MQERRGQENRGKTAIDYSQYSQLHIEDSPRKIAELIAVTPTSFRGRRMLDVGADAGIITRAIGEQIGAKDVQAVEPSVVALPYVLENLRGFEQHAVHQTNLEQFVASDLFDLTMFIDVLEHLRDPVELLKKASRMSRFALIRSPLEESVAVQVHSQLYGEDIQQLMEQRYGHIHHFSQDSLRDLLDKGGFDVIKEDHFRIPEQASILDRGTDRFVENLSWRIAKGFYPNIWGGFYVAFLKSRNSQIIDSQSEQIIQTAVREEFGEGNIVSISIFGSTTRYSDKRHSDYDFTIILDNLPDNIHEREQASPRLKRKLREKGIDELCAFNLYTAQEFLQADTRNSWLVETMKAGYRVLYDRDKFLEQSFMTKKPTVKKVDTLVWSGVDYEDGTHLQSVINRHLESASILEATDPDMAAYYRREAHRGQLIQELYRRGIYDTKDSLFALAKKLQQKFGVNLDMLNIQREDFDQEMYGKRVIYGYDQTERHLQASSILEAGGKPLDALFHAYAALRNTYLHILHSNDQYVVEGEITQLFLREFGSKLPAELLETIYSNSFTSEQILGRSGYISFDLDKQGKPIYEDATSGNFDYGSLLKNIREIIGNLEEQKTRLIPNNGDTPTISVVIATYNRPQYLEKCLEGLNNLIIPEGKVELVIVDDGSTEAYDIEHLQKISRFPFKFIRKEHSGITETKNRGIEEGTGRYVAFLDDDMVVSPLWLTQLMSGFKDQNVAGVGSTNLTYPDQNPFTQYIDYRELIRKAFRDETGEIMNVITSTAVLRMDILQEVGGFNVRQSAAGVPFGGDDVDLTWRIRDKGYQFRHVEGAIAFHNHRNSLKGLIKQHIGYGEGTMFHCIDSGRNPAELGIPEPTYGSVSKDIYHYMSREVPKRIWGVYRNHLGFKKALQYPFLDLMRRVCYDIGILRSRKFLKK